MTTRDYSPEFYRDHSKRYSQIAHEFLQSVYQKSSHPGLKHDWDIWDQLKKFVPGKRGLDAGCGAGARDVYHAWSEGYDVTGIDAIEENIEVARDEHPEIADRVWVADLGEPLQFEDESFDFVVCNAVIQHIEPDLVRKVVLPELARVLRPQGVLQLMFKHGQGILTMFDPAYGLERTFQLYEEDDILSVLGKHSLELIAPGSPDELAGLMYLTDGKAVDHCVLFARKNGTYHQS
ncbi:MAG: class I SAM-dependent methyltransferase [Chloroflexi bacterium]|nr:class I SAM-dependent methyltransferase [Chloroflexota bacterium]MCH8225564.1 class I SAM-dependent methyltransferase [Chloroflexota bacterium]